MTLARGVLAAALGLGSLTSFAGTVPIWSGADLSGVTAWNVVQGVTGPDVLINAYTDGISWQMPVSAQWISFTPSGWGQTAIPDVPLSSGVPAGGPTASFYQQFILPGPALAGQVQIWADDTAAVFLDGHPVVGLGQPLARAYWCASSGIGCSPSQGGMVDLSGLDAGTHTLRIDAYQLWGDTFGVLYEGAVTFADVPEPSSLLLLAGGLAALVLRRARR